MKKNEGFFHNASKLSTRDGGCQCGSVRYRCVKEAEELYVCHCKDCRAQSSSAFGISFIVFRSNFSLTKGNTSSWKRFTDSGRKLECVFCTNCGSRLWHQYSDVSETLSIKGGSLDVPVDISNATHIWTIRKLKGVIIPEGVKQYPKEPPLIANSPENKHANTQFL